MEENTNDNFVANMHVLLHCWQQLQTQPNLKVEVVS